MAAVTPQKRSHSSTNSDGSPSAFETPVKKLMVGFARAPSPLKKLRSYPSASPIKGSPSSRDEVKENEGVLGKPTLPRRLDISPLQAASVPTAPQMESSRKCSPKPASSYKLLVPAGAFYGKEKHYLTPLERKQLKESCYLAERNRDENVPAASRTEKMNVNFRNTTSKPTKSAPSSKHGKPAPKKLKKAKGEVPTGKASVGKENVNCLIKKKMDSPFRVLSMTVKPALKLQLGAAFFSAKKKSHSKKPVGDTKSPQDLPKSPQENDQPSPPTAPESDSPDPSKVLKEGGILPRISVPQKVENRKREDSRSCVNQEGDSAHGGKAIPRRSGSSSGLVGDSKPAAEGDKRDGDVDELGSSAPCEPDDGAVLPCPSPPKASKQASPPSADVYPIFSAPPASRKRTQALVEELTSALGSSTPARPPHTSQKRTRELCKRSRDQMIIDAGQKHFGAVVCRSCGMMYTAASPEDEAQHIQHHQRFLEALRYVGWKKERVVAEFWDGKILLILPTDPKYAVKKAEDVQEIVDNELGFKQVPLSCPAKTKIYFFVSNEKMIVGCLVAESIKQEHLHVWLLPEHPGNRLL
uniref:Establishment of sister chromatid cohesion N-acetyltransferase 2 n=1 Tax=Hypotaenidia okinawae TaxID=2861861 RepID=A0A6G1RM69_9GRUI